MTDDAELAGMSVVSWQVSGGSWLCMATVGVPWAGAGSKGDREREREGEQEGEGGMEKHKCFFEPLLCHICHSPIGGN